MTHLLLVGIGTGNPEHITLQAIRALNSADLILIPRKGAEKADLADLRRTICAAVLTNPATRIAEFDLPRRDAATPDYLQGVEAWHDAIATTWARTIDAEPGPKSRVALLVWGDPSLYDSTLRIAERLAQSRALTTEVIPGITALQALTAAHRIPINALGAPFLVTTGRQLRDHGWPEGTDTIAVMLDGTCAFQSLDPAGITIWWGAYVGMPEEITLAGDLKTLTPKILRRRAEARAAHGWIMDIYILRRPPPPAPPQTS